VNLVSAVRDQGHCGTCVGHVIASAAESAMAAALRVDASLLNFSHSLRTTAPASSPSTGGGRSCGPGWSFPDALSDMITAPAPFFTNSSCTGGLDPSFQSWTDARLKSFCLGVPAACRSASFKCNFKTLSDGYTQIQRYIRAYGSMMTRLLVTRGSRVFRDNPTGVYTVQQQATAAAPPPPAIKPSCMLYCL